MKRKKTIRAGRLVMTIIYSAPCISDGQPHIRAQKSKCSTEAQKRLNHKHAWQKLEMLAAANFDETDFFVTLTYSDDNLPYCRKLAVDRVRRCLRKMRERMKKCLPYIYVTEDKHEGGRLHHHILIKGTDLELLKECWNWGEIEYETIDAWGYEALAKYMTKESAENKKVGSRTWSQSIGLLRPTVETEICKDDADVTVPAGCTVVNSDSKLYEYGSWRYIKYLLPRTVCFRHTRPTRKKKKTE